MTEREEDCRKSKSLEELWEEIQAENKKTYNNDDDDDDDDYLND